MEFTEFESFKPVKMIAVSGQHPYFAYIFVGTVHYATNIEGLLSTTSLVPRSSKKSFTPANYFFEVSQCQIKVVFSKKSILKILCLINSNLRTIDLTIMYPSTWHDHLVTTMLLGATFVDRYVLPTMLQRRTAAACD